MTNQTEWTRPDGGKSGPRTRTIPRETVAGIAVEQIQVPYPTSNSGVALKASVTMPKSPWETDQ